MNGDGREVGRGGEGGNEMVVYQPDETLRLEVRLRDETVWLTQEQMGRLFGRSQPVIARHIANIFREGELDREVVYAKSACTTRHGARRPPGQTATGRGRRVFFGGRAVWGWIFGGEGR